MVKVTKEAIKAIDPAKINIIEIPDVNEKTMIKIIEKVRKEFPEAVSRVIILSEKVDVKTMSLEDLVTFRDMINSILDDRAVPSNLNIALKLLSSVMTDRLNEKQMEIVYNRIRQFLNDMRKSL